jgi:hypothetical protein
LAEPYTELMEWLMGLGGMILVALFLWLEVRRRKLKDYTREDSRRKA